MSVTSYDAPRTPTAEDRAAGLLFTLGGRRLPKAALPEGDVSNAMRGRGWQLPAYTFPEHRTDLAALRVVVRRGFTDDLADMVLADLTRALAVLDVQERPVHTSETASAFHH